MKITSIKHTLMALVVALGAAGAHAQQPAAHSGAHTSHRHQIAKATTAADRARLAGYIESEIGAREAAPALSPRNTAMLDDILKEASTHLGKSYRHGTHGPATFDCSGFTSYVYSQFGYRISPGSRVQYTQGEPVAYADLRKGDLVFFTSRSSGGNVGHVGMVSEVNPQTGAVRFIHASVKGVRYNEITGYYKDRYIGARRIIH